MVRAYRLARDEGDGSASPLDDKYDGEEYTTKDDRANTRTTFYERDIDKLNTSQQRKQRLKRLLRRHEGEDYRETYSENIDSREQQNREEWKRRVVTTYASQLGLTDRQKQRATRLVVNVLTINTFGRFSVEQVALGVINVVAREDGRWIEDESDFRSLLRDCGVSQDAIKQLRLMVRDRIPDRL